MWSMQNHHQYAGQKQGWFEIGIIPSVEFDKEIRKLDRMEGEAFVHRALKPLDEIDFDNDIDRGQGVLAFGEECEGMCGL
jgi:hypothetical protein